MSILTIYHVVLFYLCSNESLRLYPVQIKQEQHQIHTITQINNLIQTSLKLDQNELFTTNDCVHLSIQIQRVHGVKMDPF